MGRYSEGETVVSILDKFSLSLRKVCQEVTEIVDYNQNDDLNTDEFWDKFVECSELVSHDATNICMMFKDDSLPSVTACESLMRRTEDHCMTLAIIFYSFPRSRGSILHKEVRTFVLTVLQSLQDLCAEIKRKSSNKLQSLGRVWEECEAVRKLPREPGSQIYSPISVPTFILYIAQFGVLYVVHNVLAMLQEKRVSSGEFQFYVQDLLQLSIAFDHTVKPKNVFLLHVIHEENKSAVMSLIRGQLSIVQDALQEIQMCMNNGSEEGAAEDFCNLEDSSEVHPPTHWTDSDLQLLPSCVGLIKTVKACLKRTNAVISSNGNIDNNSSIAHLDSVAEICKSSSSFVDDFVLSLYPPIELHTLKEQASVIADICKKLLSTVCDCHFCKEEDKRSWITFLRNAIDHNYSKIIDLIEERLLPEND